MEREERIKVGVIGLGTIANAIYLPILSELDNVEISAIMCRTESTMRKAAAKFGAKRICFGLEEFVDTQPDCVFILTPKDTHTKYVIPLLEKGIDVFCEKPMAMSLDEASRMVEVAEKIQRILMIGFNRRYAPVYAHAKEVFKEKPPDVCFLEKNRPDKEYRASFENAIHMVDLMRWYCGECKEVHACSQSEDPYYETNLTAQLRFSNGSIGLLLASRTAGQWMERAEIYGGNKTVIVECPERVRVLNPQNEVTINTTSLAMGWADVRENLGFRKEVKTFLECVKTRNQPCTCATEALKTHILMDEILRQASLPGL